MQNSLKDQKYKINQLKNLRRHEVDLWFMAGNINFKKISAYFFETKNIKSNFNNYELKLFSLPFHNYSRYEKEFVYSRISKPVAYLEQTNDHVILATGNGVFFNFDKSVVNPLMNNDNLSSKFNKLELKKISTNIRDIIKNDKIYYESDSGIRDLMILDNKLFVSYNNAPTKECFNTSIMVADLNLESLNFAEFFTYNECVSEENKKYQSNSAPATWSGGGKMHQYKDGKIIFTIGEYNDRTRAQNKDSMFGKILSIDLETKNFQIISMGHRNPQGLFYSKDKSVILSTEHGPRGGDEININLKTNNEKIENFGWPISSYGMHYDGQNRDEAPLHKSHEDYGFIEPIKYYVPSIAITEIIKVSNKFNESFTNDFFIGSMGTFLDEGDLSIHHIRFNGDFNKIEFEDIIPLGQRVRDLILLEKQKVVISILENMPAISFLKLTN